MGTFNYQTTSRTILADLYTPVGVYMRLRDLYPQSALMESSDYHEQSNSRSFIGINPIASVAIGHGAATVTYPDGTTMERPISADFGSAEAIHALIDRIHVTGDDAEVCGLFGYTSFNAVRYFEDIAVKDETQEKNDAPDLLYILYKVVIVFDHHNNMLKVVELQRSSGVQEFRSAGVQECRSSGVQECRSSELQIDTILKAMNRASVPAYDFHPVGDVRSTLTDEEHKANIRRGIKHCLRGDVFQIVLSRRFIQSYEGDDFKLYRALRSVNPSPYLFYFDFGGFRIFGSSPETHCRIVRKCEDRAGRGYEHRYRAYIDPIAGTTKRTGDAEADRRGAEFLRNDPKWKDSIIYWGPMGCLTGNYLIMKGEPTCQQVRELMIESFTYVVNYDKEVPGTTPSTCGNYLLHDLPMAKWEAKRYVERLKNSFRCEYPGVERPQDATGKQFYDA